MHHKYHTEGLVVGSVPSSEANKFIFILTRDFGLLGAHAQGIRSSHSKLRFSLQDFSHSNFSFVHGKSGWKIVGATPKTSWFTNLKHNPSKLYVCAQTVSFLRKLVRGEEKDEELFDIVSRGFSFLAEADLTYTETGTLQCLVMLRILNRLGYVGFTQEFEELLQSDAYDKHAIEILHTHQKKAVEAINKALKESHL